MQLRGEDLVCYLNKIRPVYLRKCPYDHLFINKAYLGNITATNIYKSVTHKMAAKKTSWHRYGTKLRHSHPMYSSLSYAYPRALLPNWSGHLTMTSHSYWATCVRSSSQLHPTVRYTTDGTGAGVEDRCGKEEHLPPRTSRLDTYPQQ